MKYKIRPLIASILVAFDLSAFAQGTVFAYQGHLTDGGQPANGTNYGMVFNLYDAPTNGNLMGNLVIPSITVSNGLFTAPLDFGNVFDGTPRWIEISVQKNGSGFTPPLVPRQPILPVPYAVFANTASNLSGTVTLGQLPASVVINNQKGVNLSGSFSGDGSALTNLNLTVGSGNNVVLTTNNKKRIPVGVTFWDDFQRSNTTPASGLGYAPSISPVTGTNYLWYAGAVPFSTPWPLGNTNFYINNTVLTWTDGASPTSNAAVYPTVDLGFKPSYFGCQYRMLNTSGVINYNNGNNFPGIVFVVESSDKTLQGAYHFVFYPGNSANIDFWTVTNTLVACAPEGNGYLPPGTPPIVNGEEQTFQAWIDGAYCTVDFGGSIHTFHDPNFITYGGRYFTVELWDNIGATNVSNSIQLEAVWAGANLNPTTSPTGGFSTNIVIGGNTFYITNGIIMNVQ